MSLFIKIKEDRVNAFKAKEQIKKDILGVLLGEASKEVKEPDDAKVIAAIKKLIKSCNECIINSERIKDVKSFIDKAEKEIEILNYYLPKQLTEVEINDILSKVIVPDANISIGEVMRYFRENHEGMYDGGLVSKLAMKIFRG